MRVETAAVMRAALAWSYAPPGCPEVRTQEFLLDRRLQVGADRGAPMALVKGRVRTSAPILRRAGVEQHGEDRSSLLGRPGRRGDAG